MLFKPTFVSFTSPEFWKKLNTQNIDTDFVESLMPKEFLEASNSSEIEKIVRSGKFSRPIVNKDRGFLSFYLSSCDMKKCLQKGYQPLVNLEKTNLAGSTLKLIDYKVKSQPSLTLTDGKQTFKKSCMSFGINVLLDADDSHIYLKYKDNKKPNPDLPKSDAIHQTVKEGDYVFSYSTTQGVIIGKVLDFRDKKKYMVKNLITGKRVKVASEKTVKFDENFYNNFYQHVSYTKIKKK